MEVWRHLQALDLKMFLLAGMIVGGSIVDVFSIGGMIDQVSTFTPITSPRDLLSVSPAFAPC